MAVIPALIPIFRAEDASGASLPGALLYTYAAGTTTPLATYKDSAGTQPNTNPIECDSNGLAIVYLTEGVAYKLLLTDSIGTVQPKYPIDNVIGGSKGIAGTAGTILRDGSGVPSNALGVNGDYYLNNDNGDMYRKSTGTYSVVTNIKGPAGSERNVIINGSFYLSLTPWVTSGTDAPTLGTGRTAITGAAQLLTQQSVSVAVTKTGSISQAFSIQEPDGTQNLTFRTACYLEGTSAANANTGYVKAYIYDAVAGTETLVGTFNMTATSSTPTWTERTVDITSNIPAKGDYGVRFEIRSYTDNIGGGGGTKGTITAIEDVALMVSSAGVAGPQGPVGPTGATGSSSGVLKRVTITGSQTWTSPPSVNYIDVILVGGGGGGAGGNTSHNGGGGGGGGACIRARISVTPETDYPIVIGAGGGGSGAGIDGVGGGNTTFNTSMMIAGGGNGGVSSTTAGGTGGLVTYYTLPAQQYAIPIMRFAGFAATGGVGGNGGAGTGGLDGASREDKGSYGGSGGGGYGGGGGGGACIYANGGNGGNGSATPTNGSNGSAYGGGGGGAGGKSGGSAVGGNGGEGVCIIEYVG